MEFESYFSRKGRFVNSIRPFLHTVFGSLPVSVRRHSAFADTVKSDGGEVGIRTKRLKTRLVELLTVKHGKSARRKRKRMHRPKCSSAIPPLT
jgi:hypothetical protein